MKTICYFKKLSKVSDNLLGESVISKTWVQVKRYYLSFGNIKNSLLILLNIYRYIMLLFYSNKYNKILQNLDKYE